MGRLPVFWLPLALSVLITSRCAIGSSTKSQLQQIVSMILFDDKLYDDVLSEKVKLDEDSDKLPPCFKEAVVNLKDVDPLVSLHALSTPHPYYSGDNLNLSLIILGKSIKCRMNKRVAFHLALIIGLIQNEKGLAYFKMRSRIFTYTIPFYIDMLLGIDRKYDNLYRVYKSVHGMFSSLNVEEDPEAKVETKVEFNVQDNIDELKKELEHLSEDIKSSCVDHEMKQYCKSLKLEKLKNCADNIDTDNIISNLDVKTFVAALMENENAILNMFDEMDWLRGMDMRAWKVWLKTPDLPSVTETEEFKRTKLPKYRDDVEDIITARDDADAIRKEKELEQAKDKKVVEIPVEIITSPTEPVVEIPEEETPPVETPE